ncbi:hypothetical protein CICLE_v10017981mg, partial [Citrus x clementina]
RCKSNPCRFLRNKPEPPMIQPEEQLRIRVCNNWISDSCVYGDKCRFLHSWVHSVDGDNTTNSLATLMKLNGHKKAVTHVGLPSGSNKLYSGSREGRVSVWDRDSGRCVNVITNGAEIGCLIREGSWVFLGLPNAVKSWRVNAASGPIGQVNALVVNNDLLFAGSEGGVISVWKGTFVANPFKQVASIRAPLCSNDNRWNSKEEAAVFEFCGHTIRTWNLDNLECVQTLKGHSDTVTSLLFWDEYLFSSSLDETIKIWFTDQDGCIHTPRTMRSCLHFFGMLDAEAKPVLFSSGKDSAIRLYELPSFKLRARIFSRREVEFFPGDTSGSVGVWKWLLAEQQKMET